MIYSKMIGIGMIAGLCSMAALAEPAIQPGDTLESLSKVKVTTTVNGQPGSINDLINSGQVQAVSAPTAPADAPVPPQAPAPDAPPQDMTPPPAPPMDGAAPQDPNTPPPPAPEAPNQSADPMAHDGHAPAPAEDVPPPAKP